MTRPMVDDAEAGPPPETKEQDAQQRWRDIVTSLGPNASFEAHLAAYKAGYGRPIAGAGSQPAWFPTPQRIQESNIAASCRSLGLDGYDSLWNYSVQHRSAFWEHVVETLEVPFHRKYETVFGEGGYFQGARLNIAEACFGPSNAPAIVLQREGDSGVEAWSVEKLQRESAVVASALVNMGFLAGDCIAIDMPMTAECVSIYLGIVLAGMCVVSIADSFSAEEIDTRLRISEAKAIFTVDKIYRANKAIPLYTRVLDAAPPPVIVLSGRGDLLDRDTVLRDEDTDWGSFKEKGTTVWHAESCDVEAATNILFSSGTTGAPKAIPWTHSTPIKAAMDAYFHHDIKPGDVLCWPTNVGWMMGPWLIYAALMNKATIALYYGSPVSVEFSAFVETAQVTMLGVVPSMVKQLRSKDLVRGVSWDNVKVISSTGEASNPEDYLWLMSQVKGYAPVIEYCGGTEIGGGYLTGTVVQPQAPSFFSTVALGLNIVLLDEEQQYQASSVTDGEVGIVPPSVGLSTRLLNRDHDQVYFKDMPAGLRRHGDQIRRVGSYFRALGRSDDTMNLGGIKTSSAEIERVCNQVDGISETAAVAVMSPQGGPSQLVVFLVRLPGNVTTESEFLSLCQREIKRHLNPLFHLSRVACVPNLPRTASNKIMRRLLRRQLQLE